MDVRALFHTSDDGVETWHLLGFEDGSFWVEHTSPNGSKILRFAVFVAREPDDSKLSKFARAALTKALTEKQQQV